MKKPIRRKSSASFSPDVTHDATVNEIDTLSAVELQNHLVWLLASIFQPQDTKTALTAYADLVDLILAVLNIKAADLSAQISNHLKLLAAGEILPPFTASLDQIIARTNSALTAFYLEPDYFIVGNLINNLVNYFHVFREVPPLRLEYFRTQRKAQLGNYHLCLTEELD